MEFVVGEYAGGAISSLRILGRRVGVVVGNGLVIRLFATTGDAGDILEERDLDDDDDDNDDLGSFFEVNRLKLKGMLLSLEDVLICEQKVGAGERVAISSVKFGADVARAPWLEVFLCRFEGRFYGGRKG